MQRLEGKIAVVTGGSSGMGRATAQQFVAEGATVIITGRRKDKLDEAVAEIGGAIEGFQEISPTGQISSGCTPASRRATVVLTSCSPMLAAVRSAPSAP